MKTVYVAGHRGMVGAAIVRCLTSDEESDKINVIAVTRSELDLTLQADVRAFFASNPIDEVYLAAAKVGGIHANNTYPAEFIYDNLMVQANVVDAAYRSGVRKLLFLGSSCIYPRLALQPMAEAELMQGALEPTNEPYAMAKIAGIKLCESYSRQYGVDFRSVMPTNLYGPGDNFHPDNSHVIPAMMRRFHEGKVRGDTEVVVWGTGTPMREFLHVDDMAAACVHVMNLPRETYTAHTDPMASHINVGTGQDCTIAQLAHTLAQVIGFEGKVVFDASKPDGTPRKLLNVDKLHSLGWQAQTPLHQGLEQTYAWFLQNAQSARM